jgi:ATP synthase F1 complex assembly factor 1
VVTLFPELLFQKGLVLVRGDIINFKLNKPEAEALYGELRKAYFTPEVFEMMVNFNHNTGEFKMEKYNELYNL